MKRPGDAARGRVSVRGLARSLARHVRDHGALALMKAINRQLRRLSAAGHRLQMAMEWRIRPQPEWFDHLIDVHYQWGTSRLPFFLERGIFNLLAIRPGATVLELCCGDGFNAHHFYSIRAGSVLAVDTDPWAIRHARRNFRAANVNYEVADILTQMPQGTFDNVIWDAAIEHFTVQEIATLLGQIRARLRRGGVLSGYTILREVHKQHPDHEHEFQTREELARFISPHFANVLVIETDYPVRRNLYFFASDEGLPFDPGWPGALRVRAADGPGQGS